MSYIFSYEPEIDRRYPIKKNRHIQLPVMKLLLLLIACCGVYTFIRLGLARYLIPGDPEVTAEAFTDMVHLVKEGEPVGSAITTFVQDVLAGGR